MRLRTYWEPGLASTARPSASPCPRLLLSPQALCADGPPLQGTRALDLAAPLPMPVAAPVWMGAGPRLEEATCRRAP
jgi:hypothetical protein